MLTAPRFWRKCERVWLQLSLVRSAASIASVLWVAACAFTPNRPVASVLSFTTPTLIEYGADWCPPCKTLSPKLDAFASAHPEIKVVKIDLTHLSDEEAQRLLSGADAFPVIRIFDEHGHFRIQLTGADCFGFESALHNLQPKP